MAIAKAGAKAIATGSHGAAESLGFHDGEELPLDLVLDNARRIMGVVDVPVSIDFESGYARDPDGVAANLAKLAATGAVGCNFEDSVIGGEGVYPIAEAGRSRRGGAQGGGRRLLHQRAHRPVPAHARRSARRACSTKRSIARRPIWRRARAASSSPGLRDVATIAEIVKRTGARINIIPGPGQPTQRVRRCRRGAGQLRRRAVVRGDGVARGAGAAAINWRD